MERKLPPPRLTQLHIFSDSSVLRKMPAKDLCKIPIWHGNRILNEEHKNSIAASIGSIRSLDLKPFHLVTYPCEDEISTFIVDGQHRVSILKDAFFNNHETENFDVLVVEKSCASQAEVAAYFKMLNTTRAIEWKEDPKMLAGPYVTLFETAFNKDKKDKDKLVRAGTTKRPYMSVEKLREAIVKNIAHVMKKTPELFVEEAEVINKKWLSDASQCNDKLVQRAIALGFILACDDKFSWIVTS
jgi:hypothetical protein